MADNKKAFDTGLVSDLARILNETDLTEIEVEQGEMRVRVSREVTQHVLGHAMAAAPAAPAPAPAATQPGVPDERPAADAERDNAVPAPMVGTAYLAPAPDAEPFVTVGAKVTEGETLLIIEAMKVMNQIAAPRAGTVTEILIEDGEPVEFGQPLLIIA